MHDEKLEKAYLDSHFGGKLGGAIGIEYFLKFRNHR